MVLSLFKVYYLILLWLPVSSSLYNTVRNTNKKQLCKGCWSICHSTPKETPVELHHDKSTSVVPSPSNNGSYFLLNTNFLLLNSVAILWGTQHLIIKDAVGAYPSTSLLNFARFLLSSVFFAPGAYNAIMKENTTTLKAGAELGLYTFLGFALQAIGLETTTASRSAFLLYLNVKLVPFFAAILLQRQIAAQTWISALIALVGTYLLSTDGGPMNSGDLWCIGAAASSALFILRLEHHASNIKNDPIQLNGVSFITVTFLCGLWLFGDLFTASSQSHKPLLDMVLDWYSQLFANPYPPLYLGLIITGLCGYLQTIGQKNYPAEKAAIIFSMDPVYAAFFSWLFVGERLGVQGWIGSLLILSGIWLSSITNNNTQTSDPDNKNQTVTVNENEDVYVTTLSPVITEKTDVIEVQ